MPIIENEALMVMVTPKSPNSSVFSAEISISIALPSSSSVVIFPQSERASTTWSTVSSSN